MASYNSTQTFLRSSVLDAAMDIGLMDGQWLDAVPESPNEKTPGVAYLPPRPVFGVDPLSSPESESQSSHNSLSSLSFTGATGLTKDAPRPYPASASQSNARGLLPHQLDNGGRRSPSPNLLQRIPSANSSLSSPPPLKSSVTPWEEIVPRGPTVPQTPVPVKPPKQKMKLLKKSRPPPAQPKQSFDSDATPRGRGSAPNSNDLPPEERGRYAFLKREPSPAPKEKESKSFFGRLRDRSRSKPRAPKNSGSGDRNSEDDGRRGDTGAQPGSRGRDGPKKHVQMATVTVRVDGGAPQLELDPISSRKSTDLLTSLNAQLAAGAGSGLNLDMAIGSSSSFLPFSSEPEKKARAPGVGPRYNGSIMDRPHPKIRTSGYWANKDRGVAVNRVVTSRTGVQAGRRTSGARKVSIRNSTGGPRRVPSSRRNSRLSQKASVARRSRASSVSSVGVIPEDHEIPDIDDEEVPALPTNHYTNGYSADSNQPAAPTRSIPVIVERPPSTRSTATTSTRPSLPTLSIPTGGLQVSPANHGTSPLRSPGKRGTRQLPPSPLKAPSTPLPPAPSPSPSVGHRVNDSQDTNAEEDEAQVEWFDDDDASSDGGISAARSRPPSDSVASVSYLVPTPPAATPAFQQVPTDPILPSEDRPPQMRSPPRRAPTTAEGRARAGSLSDRLSAAFPDPLPESAMARRPSVSKLALDHVAPRGRLGAAPSAWGKTSPLPAALPPPTAPLPRPIGGTSVRDRIENINTSATITIPVPPGPSTLVRTASSSSLSAQLRGRISPFPTRPNVMIPKSPSGQNTPIPAPTNERPISRQDSGRSASSSDQDDISPVSGFLKRRPSVVNPVKVAMVERYNDMSLNALIPNKRLTEFPSRTVVPIPSPIPSPKPPTSDLPHMPHLQHRIKQSSESLEQASSNERSAPGNASGAQPRPLLAPQRLEVSRTSKYSTKGGVRNSTFTQNSVYSTNEGGESDNEDRFPFDDYDDHEDEEMAQGRGFDVIAAMLSGDSPKAVTRSPPSPPRAASRQSRVSATHPPPSALPRAASRQSRTSPSPPPSSLSQYIPDLSGRQKRVSNRPMPSTLGIPSGPRSTSTSPLPSPNRRRAAPGGAQWI